MPGHRPVDMLVQWTTRDVGEPLCPLRHRARRPAFRHPRHHRDLLAPRDVRHPALGAGWVDPGALHTAVMAGLTPDTATTTWWATRRARPTSAPPPCSFLSHPGVGPHLSVSVLAWPTRAWASPTARWRPWSTSPRWPWRRACWPTRAPATPVRRRGWRGRGRPRAAAPAAFPAWSLHNGDISYARGYGALWDTFLFQQRAVLEAMPGASPPSPTTSATGRARPSTAPPTIRGRVRRALLQALPMLPAPTWPPTRPSTPSTSAPPTLRS